MVPPHKVLSVEDGKIPNNRLMSRLKTLHTLYLHRAFGEAQLHFFSWDSAIQKRETKEIGSR